MNKHIIGLVLAGLICLSGQVTKSYANENLNEEVQVKTEQARTQNGWVKGEYDKWYYYKNGEMLKNQWFKDNDKWYYFGNYGNMYDSGIAIIDGKRYIFDESGAMIQKNGWVVLPNHDDYSERAEPYCFWVNGDGTVKTDSWQKYNGKWYYFTFSGVMINRGPYYIDGKRYIFDESGAMVEKKGWIVVEDYWRDPYWYWGNGDGTVKRNYWVDYNGKWYYFGIEGSMIRRQSYSINGKYYIFGETGEMIEKKGWILLHDIKGDNYFYWGNGDGTVKTNEWIQSGGKWYYADYDGLILKDKSSYIDGKEYVFDSNGVCINPY